jgi:hypothetical protein
MENAEDIFAARKHGVRYSYSNTSCRATESSTFELLNAGTFELFFACLRLVHIIEVLMPFIGLNHSDTVAQRNTEQDCRQVYQ